MESVFKTRAELLNIIEIIKENNTPESCLTAFTIIKALVSKIISNPTELKYRIIKKSNNTVKCSLLNVKHIINFLNFLGFQEIKDYYEMSDEHNDKCQITIGVLEPVLSHLEEKVNEKEAGKSYFQNPQAIKEKAKIEQKIKEEADAKERVQQLIENDKKERQNKNTNKNK